MLQLLSGIYSGPTLEHLLYSLAREQSGHEEDELRVGLAQVERHEDILSGSGQVLDTATATQTSGLMSLQIILCFIYLFYIIIKNTYYYCRHATFLGWQSVFLT